ncbi:MAG: putative aminopeptidase, partial [Firmicutes bacterium]|nr:putative aminopeptidase [Bacillota bacterium]
MGGWPDNILRNCLGLRPGESVVVLTDEPLGHARDALCAAAGALQAKQVHAHTLPGPGRIALIPAHLMAQVREADVIVSLLSALDLAQESPVLRAISGEFHARGVGRWAYGAQIDHDVLAHEFTGDYHTVERHARRLAAELAGADQVHITSDAGTDITLCIGERPLHVETGILAGRGAYGNLPGGEVFAAPLEESAEGQL